MKLIKLKILTIKEDELNSVQTINKELGILIPKEYSFTPLWINPQDILTLTTIEAKINNENFVFTRILTTFEQEFLTKKKPKKIKKLINGKTK